MGRITHRRVKGDIEESECGCVYLEEKVGVGREYIHLFIYLSQKGNSGMKRKE